MGWRWLLGVFANEAVMLLPDAVVIREGTFLYAECVVCDIRVLQSPMWYGTGDYEDPPEVADDRECICYYIQYGSTTERGRHNSGTGPFLTAEEALHHVSKTLTVAAQLEWRRRPNENQTLW